MKKRLSFDCQLVCVFTWKLPLIDGVRQYAGFKILQLLLIQLQKRLVFVSRHNDFELQTQSGRCKRGQFLSLISMLLGFKHKVAETGTGSNETVHMQLHERTV